MLIASIFILFLSLIGLEIPSGHVTVYDAIPGLVFVNPTIINKLFSLDLKSLDGVFWSLYVEVIFYYICCIYYSRFKSHILSVFTFLYLLSMCFYLFSFYSKYYYFGIIKLFGFHFYGWFLLGIILYKTKVNKYNISWFVCFIFINGI